MLPCVREEAAPSLNLCNKQVESSGYERMTKARDVISHGRQIGSRRVRAGTLSEREQQPQLRPAPLFRGFLRLSQVDCRSKLLDGSIHRTSVAENTAYYNVTSGLFQR